MTRSGSGGGARRGTRGDVAMKGEGVGLVAVIPSRHFAFVSD